MRLPLLSPASLSPEQQKLSDTALSDVPCSLRQHPFVTRV